MTGMVEETSIVNNVETVLAAIILGQCLLTISLLVTKKGSSHIHIPLIVFFSAFIVNSFGTTLNTFSFAEANIFFKYASYVFAYICLLLLFPSLWFYVRNITSPVFIHWRKRDAWHLIPFLIGLCVAVLVLTLPDTMLAQIFNDGTGPVTPLLIVAAFSLYGVVVMWAIQSVCYFVLVFRQLLLHKQQLKHYFSSTEDRELVWVYGVSIFLLSALLTTLLSMFTSVIDHVSYLVDILDLCLIFTLSHWGLRQGSFMVKSGTDTVRKNSKAGNNNCESLALHSVAKYEKSALSDTHIDRIAANIQRVMQADKLYLDPNLSLGDLAKAVSEPANYVSQTLNGRLGSTFFDFINTQRIQEALLLLPMQNKTILDIAYEVGFNSRSSFYKAFKREIGLTPTVYKQQMHANLRK
ncbi:AraC family transcriptional regulator [Marinomonas agarivorans]|nr:AraC family transcriptional regulator [Marinomonas agarivorans]